PQLRQKATPGRFSVPQRGHCVLSPTWVAGTECAAALLASGSGGGAGYASASCGGGPAVSSPAGSAVTSADAAASPGESGGTSADGSPPITYACVPSLTPSCGESESGARLIEGAFSNSSVSPPRPVVSWGSCSPFGSPGAPAAAWRSRSSCCIGLASHPAARGEPDHSRRSDATGC